MTKIEYDGTEILVPTSWDDVTVATFEKFHKDKAVTHRDRVARIALVCNVDAEVLFQWPTEVFSVIVSKADFIFKETKTEPSPIIEIDGLKYIVAAEESLSLGEYVDADDVQKNSEAILSNLLAIICRPAGEAYNPKLNDERAALFAAQPVSKVLGVLAFFLHCKQILDKHTAAYSSLRAMYDLLPQNTATLLKRTGGIKLSRIWPTIRYYVSMRLLKNQLRKCLHSYNTATIKQTPKKRNVNWINS